VVVDDVEGGQLLDVQSQQEFLHLAVHLVVVCGQQAWMQAGQVRTQVVQRIWRKEEVWFIKCWISNTNLFSMVKHKVQVR